jgi:hypothetical protein
LGAPVGTNPVNNRLNAGGWCRPASDILFAGSPPSGYLSVTPSVVYGARVNRTNGVDVGGQSYGATGYPAPIGTEGSSQPYSFHSGGFNVTLGDGAVKFIDESIHLGVICALVTRNAAGGDDANNNGTIENTEYKEPILDQNF